jgi:hypothetical protein
MAKVDLKNLDRYLEQEQFEETHRKVQAKKKKYSSIYKLDNKPLSK